jgi:hypothetical protein
MIGKMDGHRRRPLALVLSREERRRDRACGALRNRGFDPLGFADAGSAEAWLEEETPVVAVLDAVERHGPTGIVETLEHRGVRLMLMP